VPSPPAGPGAADEPLSQTTTPNGTTSEPVNASAVQPVNSTMTVAIQPNGDARWRVSTTFDLRSEEDVASFQSLANAFENGESPGLGFSAFKRGAASANAASERQMSIGEPLRTSSRPSEVPGNASLTLSFTWSNFAQSDNGTVEVGDAFDTEPLWLKTLGPNQKLRLRPPDGWDIVESPGVPLRDRALVWEGPTEFDGTDIFATFGSGGTGNGENGNGNGEDDDSAGLLVLVGGGLVVLIAGVVAFLLLRQSEEDETGPTPSAEAEAEAAGTAAEADADDDDVDDVDDAQTDASDEEEDVDDEGGTVDTELLSDEERIERLLDENGGRMKQANIVKETGWSNAKVSQLLSAMDEEDRIDKLRIGRENLISFPDEDVTDAQE
jgi:hypothetical protein